MTYDPKHDMSYKEEETMLETMNQMRKQVEASLLDIPADGIVDNPITLVSEKYQTVRDLLEQRENSRTTRTRTFMDMYDPEQLVANGIPLNHHGV